MFVCCLTLLSAAAPILFQALQQHAEGHGVLRHQLSTLRERLLTNEAGEGPNQEGHVSAGGWG